MHVTCSSLADFQQHLREKPANSDVFQNTIWVDHTPSPTENEVKLEVIFVASCVVLTEQGDYLVQVGIECGHDYLDSNGDHPGTDAAVKLRAKLSEFAAEHNYVMLPGSVGLE